jgi:hypothetical protein
VGLRYYFGGNKKLNERQRQDDPPSLMPQILHGLGLYGAEYNRKGNTYFSSNGLGNYGFEWDAFGFGIVKDKSLSIPLLPYIPPSPPTSSP